MFKIVEFSHLIIKEYINNSNLSFIRCLDATCGMGNDTIYLANLLKEKGHVDSYDIQEIAINITKEKLNNLNINNVTLYHKSHEYIDASLYDLAIFNLGYLPNTDKSITTKKETTMIAIEKLVSEINNNPNLLIIICLYPGHTEGKLESDFIDNYAINLSSKKYLVTKYLNYNRPTSPYIITISKTKL